MGRNLYILAATLGALALVSIVLSFTNIAQQPGSPGDASLWRMTSIALLCLALIITLAGVLSSLFEQAERRHEEQRRRQREARRKF
jgi:membrane protein DedA with SNARE-associated domain